MLVCLWECGPLQSGPWMAGKLGTHTKAAEPKAMKTKIRIPLHLPAKLRGPTAADGIRALEKDLVTNDRMYHPAVLDNRIPLRRLESVDMQVCDIKSVFHRI